MEAPYYNGLASIVNGNGTNEKSDALQPGEIQFGNVRFHPQTNDKGEAIVRLHLTNEVDMLIARNQYAWIKAWMWIVITTLYLATSSGLIVYFRSH
jgi:hypothetical protein